MGYVQKSLSAFRTAAEKRGIAWHQGLPEKDQPFSVFLTMHDPAAAQLADTALKLWPQCTAIAADGMTSTRTPTGKPWPERLVRIRHWSPRSRSASNRLLRAALNGAPVPDLDSPGMLFGTLNFLNQAFAAGASPERLEGAGRQPGPLGLMSMTASGKSRPERVIIFHGAKLSVVSV
jgi:hypothetical protein